MIRLHLKRSIVKFNKTRQMRCFPHELIESKKCWQRQSFQLEARIDMDPIRLLLCLTLGLFPRVLHYIAVPIASAPARRNHRRSFEYAIGHSWLGWYRITLELKSSGWPRLHFIEVSNWSREDTPTGKRKRQESQQRPLKRK